MKSLLPALRGLAATALLASLAGCYVAPYAPVPYTTTVPASYDRSFQAVGGAMRDQGLSISVEDPVRGVIVGQRDASTLTATVSRQADGSVRVQFDSQDGGRDPSLINRVTQSYDRRMGR